MSVDTLNTYPFVLVRLACIQCPRQHSYRLAKLAEQHGADIRLTDLLYTLSRDCPLRQLGARVDGRFEQCGAHLPDLKQLIPPDLPPAIGKLRLIEGGKV